MRINTYRLPRFVFHKRRTRLYFLRFFIIFSLFIIVFAVCDRRLKPIVREYAYNQAVYIASDTINDSINQVLSENEIEYESLITLLTDESGNITALKTNTLKINQLKSEIINNVMLRLENPEYSKLKIPVFSALGFNTILGSGPKIPVIIEPVGSASASFGSEFYEAGINQTAHRIIMNVTVDITVIMSQYSISAQINTDVDIAETIIVGTVPESYSNTLS